jgi:hypothetical protein
MDNPVRVCIYTNVRLTSDDGIALSFFVHIYTYLYIYIILKYMYM